MDRKRSAQTNEGVVRMIQGVDAQLIRKYLLAELSEEEQARVEERLMTEEEYFKLLESEEDELIDDRLSDQLTLEEQERFDAYFLSTPERRAKLKFAEALRAYVSKEAEKEIEKSKEIAKPEEIEQSKVAHLVWWKRLHSNPYLKGAAAAILVLAIALASWRIFFYQSEVSKGLAALNQAYREQRPVEARITGLDYAQPPLITRGGEQEKVDYLARDRAERRLLDEAEAHPDARSYHALGLLYLAKRDFDKAIDQFDKALKLDEKNAQVESDYGAALMEKGKAARLKDDSGKSLEYFARSLDHLTKALDLDASLLQARFNRALLYQHLLLQTDAAEDWRKYLEQDSNSKWADEARQNLKDIEKEKLQKSQNQEQSLQDFSDACKDRDDAKAWEAFSRSRLRNGNYIVDSLLNAYLELDLRGLKEEADKKLRLLSYAGDLEITKTGDRYTSDLAGFYLSAAPQQRKTLEQAQRLKRLAREQAGQSRYEKAIEFYSQAKQLFEQAGNSSEQSYAQYAIGVCYLRKPDIKKGVLILENMPRICEAAGYKWLLSRVFYSLADAHDGLTQYSLAIEYCDKSLAVSKQLEDRNGQALGYIQRAIFHESLRDYEKALNCLYQSLSAVGAQSFDAAQLWIIYDVAAKCFASIGSYKAALAYQQQALRTALEMGAPLNLSRCYSHMGAIYGKLENYDEAIRFTQMAFDVGRGLSNETIGKDIMALACLRLGHLYRQAGDYAKAIPYYDQNLEIYRALDFQAVKYESHKGKLFSYLAQGDDGASELELQTTLGLIEQYRSRIFEESNRNRFFDNEQEVYDLAINFSYWQKKDHRAAFDYSEASHARSLLDLNNATSPVSIQTASPDLRLPSGARPMNLFEIQQALPDQTQILNYAALSDKLIIWIVSKSAAEIAVSPITLKELNEKVDNYRQLILRPFDDQQQALEVSKQLYDLLIKPVESYLDKRKYICVIPDKILNYVPFIALFSSGSGRYLIEDYRLGTCPSATLFIKCSEAARAKSHAKSESLLSVGNPRFDKADFPALPDLPSSAKEAESVARLYKGSAALTGDEAKKDRVKTEMQKAEIIHLALHYKSDESSPMLSVLLLAKDEPAPIDSLKSRGYLQAYEIYDMKMPRARLAVLSACQTGIERSYNGEGAIGIARPFIKAGAPLVIASLWPVESNATAELMIRFHEYRKRSALPTAEALRRAQLETLNSPLRSPYYWAAFALIGGYAPY